MHQGYQGSYDGKTWTDLGQDWPGTRLYKYFRLKPEEFQSTGHRAADWLRQVADRLVEKSKSYGDSVGDPVRIFSKAGATEGIKVRIDDKLSRVARGHEFPGEDVIVDLVGYLALLAVAKEEK